MLLYRIDSMLGDNQFIYVDVFVIAPLSFVSTSLSLILMNVVCMRVCLLMAVALAGPAKHLTRHRPVSALLAPPVLLSLFGQVPSLLLP